MTTEPLNRNIVALDFATAVGLINEYLADVVAETLELPASLQEAMNYSLLLGGKRLRPALVLLSCDVLGGDVPAALGPAAALEMVHCFSLIHDDLPAMDDDDLRRGQPANHKKFGEALAILAGDALATLPSLVLAQSEGLSDQQRGMLTAELAEATLTMIAGQVYDTAGGFAAELSIEQQLELTHRQKTGALIRAGCRLGGIVAGAGTAELHALADYGDALGLMFQIVDDILDVTQTTEQLGKVAGKDAAAGKLTYPAVYGLTKAQAMVAVLQEQAHEALGRLTPADDRSLIPLQDLVAELAARTK